MYILLWACEMNTCLTGNEMLLGDNKVCQFMDTSFSYQSGQIGDHYCIEPVAFRTACIKFDIISSQGA